MDHTRQTAQDTYHDGKEREGTLNKILASKSMFEKSGGEGTSALVEEERESSERSLEQQRIGRVCRLSCTKKSCKECGMTL